MTTAPIKNPSLLVKPSLKLRSYIKKIENDDNMPLGIANIRSGKTIERDGKTIRKYFTTDDDYDFMNSLKLTDVDYKRRADGNDVAKGGQLLNLNDLYWLYDRIKLSNENVYFHELFEGSEVVFPKNDEIPRNPDLEKRCIVLKAQQENRQYKLMTKNVDAVRQRYPEDTISYQVKQINRHLIAIGQFILSVVAGFAFGFIGVELIIGNLDFGFRLLLGIICALVIALAELYFLAKKLNEDMLFEISAEEDNKKSKIN